MGLNFTVKSQHQVEKQTLAEEGERRGQDWTAQSSAVPAAIASGILHAECAGTELQWSRCPKSRSVCVVFLWSHTPLLRGRKVLGQPELLKRCLVHTFTISGQKKQGKEPCVPIITNQGPAPQSVEVH